jgi:hypothetical protein
MAAKARAKRMLATERLELTLAPNDVERARRAAAQNGLTVSAYLGALIRGEPIVPRPAAQLQELALIANRIASALAALAADAAEPRRLLRDANARIAGLLRAELPAYDAAVKAQVAEDTWGAPG